MPHYKETDIMKWVEGLNGPDSESCLCNLIQIPSSECLPILKRVIEHETDSTRREVLFNAIWQYRDESVLPLLEIGLQDTHEGVWKECLDGMVTIGGDQALLLLIKAHDMVCNDTKKQWIREAMDQVRRG